MDCERSTILQNGLPKWFNSYIILFVIIPEIEFSALHIHFIESNLVIKDNVGFPYVTQ